MRTFLLSYLSVLATAAPDLLTLDSSYDTSDILACQEDFVLSCVLAKVDVAALEDEEISLPGDLVLGLVDRTGEDSVVFADDEGAEATFAYKEGAVYGDLVTKEGSGFDLEPCPAHFEGCHVWLEVDVDALNALETGNGPDDVLTDGGRSLSYTEMRAMSALEQQGIDDSTTIVTFTVKFYYTYEFAANVADIPLYFDQVCLHIARISVWSIY